MHIISGFVLADLVFPVFMMYFFPPLLGLAAAANLIIDALVFFLALKFLNVKIRNQFGVLLALWALGLIADIIGSLFLILISYVDASVPMTLFDSYQIYSSPFSIIFTLLGILISGLLIYLLDLTVLRRKISLRQAKRIALIFAIATAPYTFLIPANMIYGI